MRRPAYVLIPPREERRRGFSSVIPNLVVEVLSPGDALAEVHQKVEGCLAASGLLVLAVYPNTRPVVAHRGLPDTRVYPEGDRLDGAPVLPDFSYPAGKPFEQKPGCATPIGAVGPVGRPPPRGQRTPGLRHRRVPDDVSGGESAGQERCCRRWSVRRVTRHGLKA